LGSSAVLQDLRARVGSNTTTSRLRGLSLGAVMRNFLLLIQQTYVLIRTQGVGPALAIAWGRLLQSRHAVDFLGQTSYKLLYSAVVLLGTTVLIESTVQRSNTVHSENLIDIKGTLYVDQPLFLLVSVIGLLIALFGVTVIALETRKVASKQSVLEEQSWSLPINCGAGQSAILAINNKQGLYPAASCRMFSSKPPVDPAGKAPDLVDDVVGGPGYIKVKYGREVRKMSSMRDGEFEALLKTHDPNWPLYNMIRDPETAARELTRVFQPLNAQPISVRDDSSGLRVFFYGLCYWRLPDVEFFVECEAMKSEEEKRNIKMESLGRKLCLPCFALLGFSTGIFVMTHVVQWWVAR